MADLTTPTKYNARLYTSGDYRSRLQGWGNGTIRGTTKENTEAGAVSLRARVRLLRERDSVLVRETMSDATTGAYTFAGIDEEETYTVVAYHLTHDKRAEAADGLIPEVLP